MGEKITIETDESSALVGHIESLQRTVTKRNSEIEKLTEKIEAGAESEYAKRQYEMGYKRGWLDSASEIMSQARKAAEI